MGFADGVPRITTHIRIRYAGRLDDDREADRTQSGQDRRFEGQALRVIVSFDRRATASAVARRPHVPPPPVRGRASWLRDAVRVYTVLIAALSPQRTGHGPTHVARRHVRRVRADNPTGPAHRRTHAGRRAGPTRPRHLLYAALAEPASLVLWSGETKDQLFLFLDRAGRARRTPVRGR